MPGAQFNPFLTHFCKELSVRLESLGNLQSTLVPSEFAEVVEAATHEVLESYASGEWDLRDYLHTPFEEYRELAMESIGSYSETNEKFGKITEEHADLLKQTSFISVDKISEKFADIQNHLTDEVDKANRVIHGLMEQVRNLEVKTTLDPLTKAYNRFALQEHLKAIVSKERFTTDIFALMIDIDDFKKINDQYGHVTGDKVLIYITKILKKTVREGDKVYRFGGEEFFILLNRTDEGGASLAANRILNVCRNNKALFQNKQVPITLSIGLTKLKEGDSIDSIIERSDTALYRAKNNGKNRMEAEF